MEDVGSDSSRAAGRFEKGSQRGRKRPSRVAKGA
jgi:hypothetical protein